MIGDGIFLTKCAAQVNLRQGNLCSIRRISKNLLEESSLPTSVFQKSLPNPPVPNLNKTLVRYLGSQASVLIFTVIFY